MFLEFDHGYIVCHFEFAITIMSESLSQKINVEFAILCQIYELFEYYVANSIRKSKCLLLLNPIKADMGVLASYLLSKSD